VTAGPVLHTARLRLRPWTAADRAPFAALNADPEVMRHFPAPLSRAESDALADRIAQRMAENGFGLWALEVADTASFIGFAGLNVPQFDMPFAVAGGRCLEVGWRLIRAAWGHGYATEAANAALDFAFETLGAPEVVSFTVPANTRSRAVMERLGMRYDGTFDHPALPAGHALRRHVLYRLRAEDRP